MLPALVALAAMAAASSSSLLEPEQGVQTLDGTISVWRESEKWAKLFIAKTKVDEKKRQAALLLVSGLTGDAWDEVKAITAKELEGAATRLLELMKAWFGPA